MLRFCIRLWFLCTSRAGATRRIRAEADRCLALAETLGAEKAAIGVTVPEMPGVDPEMRGWSLYQILEHDVIVNHAVRRIVRALAHDEEPPVMGDPRKDVLPSENPGPEQLDRFRKSVEVYLESVSALPKLRGTPAHPHPVFGPLTAHGWHCMCGFHPLLHRKQAEKAASLLVSE